MPDDWVGGTSIRAAVADDVADIVRIERQSFSRPWSARSFHDFMRTPSAFVIVAAPAAHPVCAYAVAYVAADVGELANFAVAVDARGKGIGRMLLEAVLDRARSLGAASLFLDVRASNVVAQALYTSTQFIEVARRRDYYAHPVEDAIVMRRSLP